MLQHKGKIPIVYLAVFVLNSPYQKIQCVVLPIAKLQIIGQRYLVKMILLLIKLQSEAVHFTVI